MNNIYDYLDYREFLKDRIDHLREENSNFSYRYFNRKAGFKSSCQLKLVTEGKRNLGKSGIFNVCKGLGMSRKEAEYFESLVFFNQSKSHDEKDHYYKELIEALPPNHAKVIESKCYKAFGHWYYLTILEMIRLGCFEEDTTWISKRLRPRVSVPRVKKALADLETLGLIQRNEKGKLVRVDKMLSTPDEITSIAITNLHEQLTDLSNVALRKDGIDEREYSALIIAVSKQKFNRLKKKIVEFRREVHALLEATDDEDLSNVVCMDMKLFKLTNGGLK